VNKTTHPLAISTEMQDLANSLVRPMLYFVTQLSALTLRCAKVRGDCCPSYASNGSKLMNQWSCGFHRLVPRHSSFMGTTLIY